MGCHRAGEHETGMRRDNALYGSGTVRIQLGNLAGTQWVVITILNLFSQGGFGAGIELACNGSVSHHVE